MSTGFEFLAVSSMPPAQFRCQLNSQRKSRHHTGPGRTLVYIQRTSSARAVSPPTQRLPIQGPYNDLLIRCGPARPQLRIICLTCTLIAPVILKRRQCIPFFFAHSLSFLLLSLLDGTLRGPCAALRGTHPTCGSASRFELASVGRGTVLE